MKDESRGTVQTSTARSNERSPRSSHARMVKVCEFSSQILLPQTTGRQQWQHRGIIRTFLRVRWRHFWKEPLAFWEIVSFLLNSTYMPHNYWLPYIYDSWCYRVSVRPCIVHFLALWTLSRITYIAAELYIWLCVCNIWYPITLNTEPKWCQQVYTCTCMFHNWRWT